MSANGHDGEPFNDVDRPRVRVRYTPPPPEGEQREPLWLLIGVVFFVMFAGCLLTLYVALPVL
jgi:hypothetical protein